MTQAISKAMLFESLGYGPPFDLLEQALEEEGLSRLSRSNVSPEKAETIESLLASLFIAVCSRGDCQAAAARVGAGRLAVSAHEQGDCGVCGGSANGRAVDELVRAWRAAGLTRLCVVGGSPNAHTELLQLVRGRIELRLVDGTGGRTSSQAKQDVAWADRVAIWGGTQLSHSTSQLYSGPHVIQFAKRSISSLAREMVLSTDVQVRPGREAP